MTSERRVLAAAFALLISLSSSARAAAALAPSPESGFLGQLVGRILEQSHYSHHAIDQDSSKQTLRNFIDTFDYNHLIFDKADIDGFEAQFAGSLDERLKRGDVSPAYDVFNKFCDRLGERLELVKKIAAEKQDYSADESMLLDRHEASWPATPEESLRLWRQRIKYELLQEKMGKAKPEEQVKTVTLRYERLLRSVREYDASDILQAYLSALAHTFDPHSDYMAPPQKENFDISMRLSLVGIGAVLRSEDGYAKIVSLVEGGPAFVDKRLKPSDKIEAVAQGDGPFLDVVGMKLDRLVQMIRGEKGTKVRLRIIPADAIDAGTRVTVSLIRDEIKLTEQEAKAKIMELPLGGRKAKLGVIDLPSFYADMKSGGAAKSTTRDVAKLITHLKKEGIEGLIIDLRRNGGGSLSEAVSLTGLFIKEGPVVQVKDSRGGIRVLKDDEADIAYSGPLIVLASRNSASASEIFAGALQDYGRAVIVGDKSTFGKGTVQSMLDLSQYLPSSYRDMKAGALKLTIQKFYRISGGSTQNRGVIPDVHLPSLSDEMEGTESSAKNAMPYDEVAPSQYERADSIGDALPRLQKESAARVEASPEFAYIREDIEHLKTDMKSKTVSLNEKKRLSEKEADEARAATRKKERAARRFEEPKAIDVTLESIDGKAPVAHDAQHNSQGGRQDGSLPLTAKVEPKPAPADVAKSTSTAKGDDYEKAPPAPDAALYESMSILADMMEVPANAAAATNIPIEKIGAHQ